MIPLQQPLIAPTAPALVGRSVTIRSRRDPAPDGMCNSDLFWTASPSPWGTPTLRLNLTTSLHAGTAVRPLQLQCTLHLVPLSLSQCGYVLRTPSTSTNSALAVEDNTFCWSCAIDRGFWVPLWYLSQQGAYRLCDAPRSLFPSGTVDFHGCASTSLPGSVCKHVPFAQIQVLRMRRSVHVRRWKSNLRTAARRLPCSGLDSDVLSLIE